MPTKIVTPVEADEAQVAHEGVDILNTEGDLSLHARLASDFLTDVDYAQVLDHDEALEHLEIDELQSLDEADDEVEETDEAKKDDKKKEAKKDDKKDGDEEKEAEAKKDESLEGPGVAVIPGGIAAALIDEGDLAGMFAHFLDNCPRDTLAEKSALAHYQDLLGIEDLEEGCFAEAAKDEGNRAVLGELLTALLSEANVAIIGTGDDSELDEAKLGQRLTAGMKMKSARIRKKPKTGKRKMELKLARRERKKHIGTARRQEKKRAKRFKRRHGMNADAYTGLARFLKNPVTESDAEFNDVRPVVGYAMTIGEALYEATAVEDVTLPDDIFEMGAYGNGKMAHNGKMNKKKGGKRHESDEESTDEGKKGVNPFAKKGDDDEDDDDNDKNGDGKNGKNKKANPFAKKGDKKKDEARQPRAGAALLHEDHNPGGAKEKLKTSQISEGVALAARMPMLRKQPAAKS